MKLKRIISFFLWSDSKWAYLVHCEEIFDSELELLTPLWQAVIRICCLAMVHATRLWFVLLGDSTCCSVTAYNCSATHHGGRTVSSTARLRSHLLGQAQGGVAQWVQGARGLAMGCTTPDTHGRPHGLHPLGWPSPQEEALRGTTLLGAFCKTSGRYPEDTTSSVSICMIPSFL